MAALYAAFELLRSVNNLAADFVVTTPGALFAQLHAEFDGIDAAVPLISSAPGIMRAMTLPKYEQIFSVIALTTGGVAATFSGTFQANLRQMIINSNNNAAAACITALGYSWINGALQAGGFFSRQGRQGFGWPVLSPARSPQCAFPVRMTLQQLGVRLALIWQIFTPTLFAEH